MDLSTKQADEMKFVPTIPWLLNLVLDRWKVFVALGLSVSVAAYLTIFFFVPAQYKAESVIIPLDQSSALGAASMLKGLNNFPVSLGGLNNASQQLDLFQTILNSRTVLTGFINKFEIKKKLKLKRTEDALKSVRKLVGVSSTKENALVVTAIDTSATVAAEMTNYLVDCLNSEVIDLNISKARANKEFLSKRFADISKQLEAAEDSLSEFQRANNFIELKSQVGASVENYSRMEAEIYAKQVEQSILSQYLSADAPRLKLLNTELRETKKKLYEIRSSQNNDGVLTPLHQIPAKAKAYLRLERNVLIYNSLSQVVLPLLEQAKYEEQKSIPVIQIIDRAVAPDKRFFPKRTFSAGIIALMACFVYLLMLIAKELLPMVTSPAWVSLLTRLRLMKHVG